MDEDRCSPSYLTPSEVQKISASYALYVIQVKHMVAYAIAFVAMMTVCGEAFQHSTLRFRLLLVHHVQDLQYAVSCQVWLCWICLLDRQTVINEE